MTPHHAKIILDLINARCRCGQTATKRLVNAAGRDLFVRACDAHAVNVDGSHAVTTSDDVPAWRDLPQAEAIRALEAEAGAR